MTEVACMWCLPSPRGSTAVAAHYDPRRPAGEHPASFDPSCVAGPFNLVWVICVVPGRAPCSGMRFDELGGVNPWPQSDVMTLLSASRADSGGSIHTHHYTFGPTCKAACDFSRELARGIDSQGRAESSKSSLDGAPVLGLAQPCSVQRQLLQHRADRAGRLRWCSTCPPRFLRGLRHRGHAQARLPACG